MNHKDYPDPDISADEAWADMKNMLITTSGKTDAANYSKPTPHSFYFYVGAGLIAVSLTAYFLMPKKSKKQITETIHLSQNKPLKDTLSDGTVAFLDRYSSVSESITANKEKLLTIKGGAYFQNITNNNKRAHRLRTGSIDVLSATAEIYLSSDSVLSVSSVQVHSGTAILEASGKRLTLTAGESIQYDEKAKRMSNKTQANVNLFSYATMIFEFNNIPLLQAVESIEKAYGVSIVIEDKKLYNCRITTRFDNKSLKEILDLIAYTLNFEYRINEETKQILLNGGGCE